LGDRRKGFDTLFAAWKVLCREPDWDATLVVVGSGARLQTWRDRSRDEGLHERIEFCGFRRDVPELLRAADVLVAPTLYEAYGLGVHEALCCGLPAFVSATAGIAERYPAECRELLIPDPRDAIGLADRLRRWRRDRPVWPDRVRPFARELAARTWDDMAADIVRLIEGGGPVGRRSHHSEGLR
jgi:glycosyltransferase involved in cell wall biosynthesis